MNSIAEVLSRYGSRAYYVLKAAIEVAEENRKLRLAKFGDFDYRSLVSKLKSWGIEYNPSGLLRVLEREYGIIRTVYRSSNQRWWVFSDLSLVKLALGEGREEEALTPDEELLDIQVAVLDIDSVIAELSNIIWREKVEPADSDKKLRDIVLNELPVIVEVYKKALRQGDRYSEFVSKVRKAFELARKAALLRNELRTSLKTASGLGGEQKLISPVKTY
ncbi:MAG: hypothetical protein RMI56_03955 [Sulfolobales archaeon]|nr:hypothetical protein [Sulfolobales archaeon]MDW8082937.1 hypothetical protein [Sulfolobales archaeon]